MCVMCLELNSRLSEEHTIHAHCCYLLGLIVLRNCIFFHSFCGLENMVFILSPCWFIMAVTILQTDLLCEMGAYEAL